MKFRKVLEHKNFIPGSVCVQDSSLVTQSVNVYLGQERKWYTVDGKKEKKRTEICL